MCQCGEEGVNGNLCLIMYGCGEEGDDGDLCLIMYGCGEGVDGDHLINQYSV